MALVNSSVQDITADTLLSQSKTKIKGNDDKLLENDVAVEARLVTAEGKVGVIEGGAFVGTARWDDIILSGTALVGGASFRLLVGRDNLIFYGLVSSFFSGACCA